MTKPIAILIDDEPDIRELLAISLSRAGFDCVQAGSYKEGKQIIEAAKPDLCITDVRMPDGSGLDLVRHFKTLHPTIPIAVMTAYDTTDIAVQAMKAGAFDFLGKPIRAQRLDLLIREAQSISRTSGINVSEEFEPAELVGQSQHMVSLRKALQRASLSMAPVLISGERGTGKEAIARAIHNNSQRKYGPFVSANCGAIPISVLESEFFGHKKEAIEDAVADKIGLIRSASGGTLFLNEVADLPTHFQTKILRALKDRSVEPIGSNNAEPIDVRIVSASNRTLTDEVHSGSLREDLYYHLNIVELTTLALRERQQDIELVSAAILKTISGEASKPTIENEALEALTNYNFPGNIRELENILHRAEALRENDKIALADLNFSPSISTENQSSENGIDPLSISDLEAHLSAIENKIILAVLTEEKWNRTKAAKRLGLTTRQFRYKLAKYDLTDAD